MIGNDAVSCGNAIKRAKCSSCHFFLYPIMFEMNYILFCEIYLFTNKYTVPVKNLKHTFSFNIVFIIIYIVDSH